jgi:hypothetical protein
MGNIITDLKEVGPESVYLTQLIKFSGGLFELDSWVP